MIDDNNKELAKYSEDVQNSFCILPFTHTFLNTEGDVFPCCVSWDPERTSLIGYLKDATLEEHFNSDIMKQLRLDLMSGKRRNDFCSRCYKSEDAGFPAGRHGVNSDLGHLIDDSISKVQPDGYIEPVIKSWDIRYSNLCNLKCRSCGNIYSTTWSKEDSEYVDYHDYSEIKAFPAGTDPLENQYNNVEKIYFAGGEPLIMPEHYATLSKIIKLGRADKVRLVYNTNMTKLNYNKNYLPDFWKQFKKVTLGLSIDSFGDRANYIRHGSVKWNKIEANIKEMSKYAINAESNIDYFFSPTVSLLNVYTLTNLHQYLFDADLIVGIDSILLNILHGPADLSMLNLPRNIKDDIQLKIEKHISWIQANGGTERSINQFKSLSDYLDTTLPDVESNIRTFIHNTRDIDRRRNENFPATFPEYRDWWEEITKNSIPTVNI
jgi:organic radical activating enzyme